MVRYVCLDFETNGFAHKGGEPKPWASFPIQVSLTAVENGELIHLYDSYIQGSAKCSNNVQAAPKSPSLTKSGQRHCSAAAPYRLDSRS